MKIEIEFRTSNAAFEEDPYGEPARLIRVVADAVAEGVAEGQMSGTLRDSNGNPVGTWRTEE